MSTVTIFGIEVPSTIQAGNVEMTWHEEPEDPVLDDDVDLDTFDQASDHLKAVFLEQSLFKNNYHFAKTILKRMKKEAGKEPREVWMASREDDWANRHNSPQWHAYREAISPYAKALQQNRRRWRDLDPDYEQEIDDLSDLMDELWQKEEAARQAAKAEAERIRQEKAREKAAREQARRDAWTPEYRKEMENWEEYTREKNRKAQEERKRQEYEFDYRMSQLSDKELREYIVNDLEQNPSFKRLNLSPRQMHDFVEQEFQFWLKRFEELGFTRPSDEKPNPRFGGRK